MTYAYTGNSTLLSFRFPLSCSVFLFYFKKAPPCSRVKVLCRLSLSCHCIVLAKVRTESRRREKKRARGLDMLRRVGSGGFTSVVDPALRETEKYLTESVILWLFTTMSYVSVMIVSMEKWDDC